MTLRLLVEVGSICETVELGDGDTALLGREPDVHAVDAPNARSVTIDQPSVSANHLVVSHDGRATTIVDAESRNGTWLRLPAGDRVEVHTRAALHVRLAAFTATEKTLELPGDATWLHRDDFHTGVATAVRSWFEAQGFGVRVTTTPSTSAVDHLPAVIRGNPTERGGGRLPLANGYQLEVVPSRTVSMGWSGALDALWRYVNAQNAIFTSEESSRSEGLILASPAIRRAHQQVVAAAQRGLRLLLIGPSGSGKDGLARCYHRQSHRTGAFVAKNCSMLGRELLRAELFGAEQGAFTGAVRRIVGAVEACNGGTLFLDEIGEMSTEVQPFLLTFLDRGEYERMGSYDTVRAADVRVVSATNKDLRAATIKGEFREDLWYRLAQQVVHVPALRERPEDIEAYLRQTTDGRIDPWSALAPDARALVLAHPWHGNFRELATFALCTPRDAAPQSIRGADCRTLLDGIALVPPTAARPAPRAGATVDLGQLGAEAVRCYTADTGHGITCWDDVKDCVERYLKPLVFADLSGASALPDREAASIPTLAAAIEADRGTVLKHLNRYFERFK